MMIVGDIAVKFLPIWSRPLNHRNDKALGKFIPDEFVMACGCQRMTARCVATSPRLLENDASRMKIALVILQD